MHQKELHVYIIEVEKNVLSYAFISSYNIFFCLNRIDSNPELLDLSIGDQIIEVNGLSVKDQYIQEIKSVLENPNEALHLMVERDPSPLPVQQSSPVYSSDTESDTERVSVSSPEAVQVEGTKVLLRPKDNGSSHRYFVALGS
jgi:hypothetical protein